MSLFVGKDAIDRMQCQSHHCWSFQVSEAERQLSRQYINENSIAKMRCSKKLHVFSWISRIRKKILSIRGEDFTKFSSLQNTSNPGSMGGVAVEPVHESIKKLFGT